MKIVGPNFSKNQNPFKHLPKMKSTVYFTKRNNLKGWKVSKILRKENCRPSACSPDTDK